MGQPPGLRLRTSWDRLPGVELRHLDALRAVAEEASFSAAADRLGYVQSAVSQQIASLERLLDARLVERSSGNSTVSLTEAGQVLLDHSREILAQFDAVQAKLAALSEGRSGSLRVGAYQGVAVNVLPRVMEAFARRCPDVPVLPTETQHDTELLELLDGNELDLAFCEAPSWEPPITGIELTRDPFVLLVSERSPLAQLDCVPALDELEHLPLIGLNSSSAQDRMVEALLTHGVQARFTLRTDLAATLQGLVASDVGVAIVPYLAIDPTDPRTTVVELPELPARTVSLAWHRDREPSREALLFVEIAAALCPRFRQA